MVWAAAFFGEVTAGDAGVDDLVRDIDWDVFGAEEDELDVVGVVVEDKLFVGASALVAGLCEDAGCAFGE